MQNEVVLNIEDVAQKISMAELRCINTGSVKDENQLMVAKELANMFGAWIEAD